MLMWLPSVGTWNELGLRRTWCPQAVAAPWHTSARAGAQRVAAAANADGVIEVAYRHSLLGAQLIAAGFVVASREYAAPLQWPGLRLGHGEWCTP